MNATYLELDDLSGIGFNDGTLGVTDGSTAILLSLDRHYNVGGARISVQTQRNVEVWAGPQHFGCHDRVRPEFISNKKMIISSEKNGGFQGNYPEFCADDVDKLQRITADVVMTRHIFQSINKYLVTWVGVDEKRLTKG